MEVPTYNPGTKSSGQANWDSLLYLPDAAIPVPIGPINQQR